MKTYNALLQAKDSTVTSYAEINQNLAKENRKELPKEPLKAHSSAHRSRENHQRGSKSGSHDQQMPFSERAKLKESKSSEKTSKLSKGPESTHH